MLQRPPWHGSEFQFFCGRIFPKMEFVTAPHKPGIYRARIAGKSLAPPPVLSNSVRLYLGNLKARGEERMIGRMLIPHKTRRWPRVPVDLPVRVVTAKGFSTTVVPGRGTELSEGGMVLYAGILLSPGDLLEVEFDTPSRSHLTAIVRSKNGFCFGLEFLAPLPD
jgi:PilZ domain